MNVIEILQAEINRCQARKSNTTHERDKWQAEVDKAEQQIKFLQQAIDVIERKNVHEK